MNANQKRGFYLGLLFAVIFLGAVLLMVRHHRPFVIRDPIDRIVRDPIDRIVKKDSANEYFPNGMFIPIHLPETAPIAEVASRALGQSITNVTVLDTRQVHISYGDADKLFPQRIRDFNYTAVLVDSSSGQKVVLLQFQQNSQHPPGSWWSRVYDLEPK